MPCKAAGTIVALLDVVSTLLGTLAVCSLPRCPETSASSARLNIAPVLSLFVRRIRGARVHDAGSMDRKACASLARTAVRLYVAAMAALHAAANRAGLWQTSQPRRLGNALSAPRVPAKLSSPSCIASASTCALCLQPWRTLWIPSNPPKPL